MSRRRSHEPRQITPDPRYNDIVVAKFVNNLMGRGKKSIAETIFYDAMDKIAKKLGTDEPLEVFKKALKNVTPALEVRSRRIGGSTYQVPIEVKPRRKQALAIRWIISFARNSSGKTLSDKLAGELISAANGEGGAIEKKKNTHKMAEANKAFAHFRI